MGEAHCFIGSPWKDKVDQHLPQLHNKRTWKVRILRALIPPFPSSPPLNSYSSTASFFSSRYISVSQSNKHKLSSQSQIHRARALGSQRLLFSQVLNICAFLGTARQLINHWRGVGAMFQGNALSNIWAAWIFVHSLYNDDVVTAGKPWENFILVVKLFLIMGNKSKDVA